MINRVKIGEEYFYLEVPNIDREKEAKWFISEFYEYNSEINGTGNLDVFLKDSTYSEWLCELENKKEEKELPSETYFFIRENDNKVVGMLNLRLKLNEEFLKFGGHIGYSIRPTERLKGYNKINLYLALKRFSELNCKEVMVDCTVKNIGSNKTIENFNCELKRTEVDPWDNELTNVYWINVEKSLDEFEEKYKINQERYSNER